MSFKNNLINKQSIMKKIFKENKIIRSKIYITPSITYSNNYINNRNKNKNDNISNTNNNTTNNKISNNTINNSNNNSNNTNNSNDINDTRDSNNNINNITNNIKSINPIKFFFVFIILFIISFSLSHSEAHILLVADSTNDLPNERNEAISIYNKLIADNYPVVLLVGNNATSESIIKGMYGADAIIYIGHGSDLDYYDKDGGISKAPYAIPTSDNKNIWTARDFLSEGLNFFGFEYNGDFIPPIKKGASVFFIHTCFATGWVEDSFVSNPDETIYKFNIPFVNAGANVYSSGYYQAYGNNFAGLLGQELYNGGSQSISFKEANNNLINSEGSFNISKSYNDMEFYTNNNYTSLFIGNLNSNVLPEAKECSEFDSIAAKKWYDSSKSIEDPIYDDSIKLEYKNDKFDGFINIYNNFLKSFEKILKI
ncbi:MAG: hypothetical protein LBM26_01660 [Methanobrevibacter sp.]|nr:hypothetical protein [Methanobrevibacter sp.]